MVEMGNVWDRTTEFLSDNAAALMPVAGATILLPAAVSTVVSGAVPTISPVVAMAVAVLMAVIALWGQLAVIALALDPDGGRPPAQARATSRLAPALGAMLLVFVVILVLALPIVIALQMGGADLAALGKDPDALRGLSGGAAAFIGLWGVLGALVVVFVSIRLALMFPVIVEQGGVIAALKRSFALTKGMFWRLFGVLLLFGLVYGVATMAVGSAFGLLFKLLAPGAGPFGIGAIVVGLLLAVVRTAYTVLVAAFSAKLYQAVVVGRKGTTISA